MKCIEIESHISALVDDELSRNIEKAVRTHIEQCDDCRKLYDLELSTKRLVSRMKAEPAPAGLRERILSSISDPKDEKIVRFPVSIWSFFSNRSVGFSTAVAAIALIGIFIYAAGNYFGVRITPFIDSVYAYHAKLPEEVCSITGSFDEVQKRLVSQLNAEIPLPDLDDLDLKLQGANGNLKMEGRACALIKYDSGNSEITHFVICCMEVPIDKLPEVLGKPGYRYASREGINMVFWKCKATNTTRCIASEYSVDQLVKIAEEIKKRSREAMET